MCSTQQISNLEGKQRTERERLCPEVLSWRGRQLRKMAGAKLAGVAEAGGGCLRRSRKLARGRGPDTPEQDLDLGLLMETMAPTAASRQGVRTLKCQGDSGGTPGRDGRLCNTSREHSTEEQGTSDAPAV